MCTRLHLTFTEIQDNPLKRLDALFSLLPKISTEVFLFMGRDPVELAKRAKYKPPAMRVRDVGYTKKSPFRYKIRLFKPIYNERKGDFMANKANSLSHTKWVCKYHIVGSVKNFVALVKNGSFLVRITDMTILIEKEFIYGSSKRPNPTDYYRKQHYQCG